MAQQHNHGHEHKHEHHAPRKTGLHKDWRMWLVVGLALAAMLMYTMSDDEALQPGGGDQPPMPAEAAE